LFGSKFIFKAIIFNLGIQIYFYRLSNIIYDNYNNVQQLRRWIKEEMYYHLYEKCKIITKLKIINY